MTEIIKDLYQFTEVMEPIKLSMHQYLLMTNEPVLIQTGAVSQAQTTGNDSNLLIVFYVQIMPDDFVMQLHRF